MNVQALREDSLPKDHEFTDADYHRGMERLLEAVQDLSLAYTLPDIQRIVRTAAREITGCDGASFVLRDNGKCYYVDEDAIGPLWKGLRFPMEICVSGWTMINRTAAVIPDIFHDARVPLESYSSTFVKSLVMVPIRKADPVGAIGNYWSYVRQPSEREIALLQALADSTSVAMTNVQILADLEDQVRDRTAELERANEQNRQLAITDELTGLNNRRGFYRLAEPALHSARRHGRSCVLAYLDIDGLKRVNDEQGHDTGDKLIADVAEVLRTTLRQSDLIARIGGDEFCVLVTEPSGDATGLRARILFALNRFNETANRPYNLSASIGLIEASPDDFGDLDELLRSADERMYEEKKAHHASARTNRLSPSSGPVAARIGCC